MKTTTLDLRNENAKNFYERHDWKFLLGVILLIGFFGVGDMFGGASDLQNGEKVYMTGVTGMTWEELKSTSPNVARMIDTIFRANGASLATIALLSLSICLSGFRKEERWAWGALWVLPFWMAMTAFFIATVKKQPGAGTPVPVISGSVLFVISSVLLLLSRRRFFRKTPIASSEKQLIA